MKRCAKCRAEAGRSKGGPKPKIQNPKSKQKPKGPKLETRKTPFGFSSFQVRSLFGFWVLDFVFPLRSPGLCELCATLLQSAGISRTLCFSMRTQYDDGDIKRVIDRLATR